MIRVDAKEAEARFSAYLDGVERGETVIVCRRNVPIAEIHAIPRRSKRTRPVGIDRGMAVPASFFEPLREGILDAFERIGGREGA